MAERYQPGDYFAKFMEQLPQVMMQQQYLVLARERLEEQKTNKVAQNLRDEEYLALARERLAEQKTNKEFSKNMQTWNGIMSFAGQLPMGQKYAFISKQSENLPEEFMIESGIGDRMEEFKGLEEQSVDRTLMFENLEQEDSTEKIQTALDLNLVIEPVRRKALRSRINKIEKKYGDQEPFNPEYLGRKDLIIYNQTKDLLEEATKTNLSLKLEKSRVGKLSDFKETEYQASSNDIIELNKSLQPYLVAGAPKKIPEFISSSESLSALNENPDLRSSFFADESNDLDTFVQERIYDPQAEAIRAKAYELEGVTTQEEYEKKMGMDEFTLEEVPIGAQYGPQGPPPSPPPPPTPPKEKDLNALIQRYKSEGALGLLEKDAKVGSVIMPINKDVAQSIYGGINVLRDSSHALNALSQPAVLASKPDDWDERYQLSAGKFKSTIKDMYSLYQKVDPVKGKAMRGKLRTQLEAYKKSAEKGKWSPFRFDEEIKSILDSIEF